MQSLKEAGLLGGEHTGMCSLMLGPSVSDNSLLSLLMTLNLVGKGGSGCPTQALCVQRFSPDPGIGLPTVNFQQHGGYDE